MIEDETRRNPAAAEGVSEGPAQPSGPVKALRSRAAWVLADSALSSLTNAGLTIGLARVVSSTEYGAFALAFTLFALVQSMSVAINNQVVVIRFAAKSHEEQRRAAMAACAGAVLVGGVTGLGLILVGLLLHGSVGAALIAMGVMLPALMLQDHWRSTFVAFGHPRRSFFLDLLWAVIWALGFVLLIARGEHSASVYILVWGCGALVAGIVGSRLEGAWPAFRGTISWLTTNREVSLPSLANTFATVGSVQLAFVLISILGTVSDLGALRGTQTLLGPLNVVGFAISSFAVPELVRHHQRRRGLIRAAVAMSAILLFVSACWGGLLLLLPDSAGVELLGETWEGARQTLPGMVLFICAINAVFGASAVMRALNRVHSISLLSAILAPLVVTFSTVGVVLSGARGAALGFAAAGVVMFIPWWVVLLRDAGRGRRESDR